MTHERTPGVDDWADLPDATDFTAEILPDVPIGDLTVPELDGDG